MYAPALGVSLPNNMSASLSYHYFRGGSSVSNKSLSDVDWDLELPMHETHVGDSAMKVQLKSDKKTKFSPPDEMQAQWDAWTIFVGNIPIDVAKSKVCPIALISCSVLNKILQ